MKIRRFFLFCLVFTIVFSTISLPNMIFADPRDLTNLDPPIINFTSATFEAYDNGVEVLDLNNIPKNAEIQIGYSFEVLEYDDPAYDAVPGDFFTISLPSEITSIASFVPDTRILSVIYDDESYDIAQLDISADGIATITFLDGIESLSQVSANFSISGTLNEDAIPDGHTVSFSLIAGGTIYTIGFIDEEPPPPPPVASIEKSGAYDPALNEVTWTVTLDSGDPSITYNDINIVDKPGPNQIYLENSSSIAEPTYDSTEETYTFYLESLTGSLSFTFKTTPTDGAFGQEGSTSTLTNSADLFIGDSGEPSGSANASVTITTNWIEKSGSLRSEGGQNFIDWAITLNNNNRIIPAGSTVTDTLQNFLVYESGSILRNGLEPSSFGDSFEITGQSFTYTFSSEATGQQVITFTTGIHPDYYRQQSVVSFTNTAALNIGGDSFGATSGSVGVYTSLLLKSGEGYNASNQRITWRMQINANGQAISNATIIETIGSNQEFATDYGVRLNGSDASITRVFNLLELTDAPGQYYFDPDTSELIIYLGNLSSSDNPVVRIQTIVTNPAHYAVNGTTNYSNTATLEGNDSIEISTSTGTQSVQSLVLAKTSISYNYNTRILSWQITLNQNNMYMPDAVITDNIPAGQEFVPGSMLIDGEPPAEGVLTLEDNILNISLGEISSQKVITFSTVVTDLSVFLNINGNVTFSNNAVLSSGISGAPTVSVTANRVVNNRALSKSLLTEYTVENGYIEWEVYVNANQAPMQNASLSDTLQQGLELNVESIELYYWNQDANGTRTVGNPVPPGDYSFEYDYDTRVFIFRLPDGPQGYYLKFKTDIVSAGTYSNTISFTGDYSGSGSASSSYLVTESNIIASATGTNGSITINKVDHSGNPITTGAEFELLDSLRNIKSTLVSSEDGTVVFERLKLRTYYIREKTPPTGYSLSTEEIQAILTSDSEQARHQIISFTNYPLSASIMLRKTNSSGTGLSGGQFAIYAASDARFTNPLQTATSGNDGIIVFRGLNAGNYIIREIEPPRGYQRTTEIRSASLILDAENNILPDVTVASPFINYRVQDAPLQEGPSSTIGLLGQAGSLWDNYLIINIGIIFILTGLVILIFKSLKNKRGIM